MNLPAPVPEIPASNIDQAASYYVNNLGFTFDWGDEAGGIAGISRGDCRLFLTNPQFRESHGNTGPILIWLNLNNRAEVDQLHQLWKSTGAKILSEPEDKPWRLREFMAADLDGNQIRVFYDFGGESRP
jgi:predicted lactoylglutathione lyase